ncbi:MAG: 4-carboxy-4-hydroxy-2-oxoadipate aldolase/oxaloacetate decarboxylase [Syntrophaceae bacterium]|nr:4-carboxy-4-hydroxy-2-oxoadipate aldolase/oxaloacetate decarboxylase [Syntrophaceae bacterium]
MEAHVLRNIPRPPRELVLEFLAFDTATVHEASGGKGALSSAIKPIDPLCQVCGPAVTVACRPGDNLILHKAIYVAEPGDVLLLTVGEYEEVGPWGEVMTVAAQARGIAGLVTDGSVRDSRSISDLKFPVFSKSLCIKGTTKDSLGRINHPVIVGGVQVFPGDLILGDADGVVVVARQNVGEVLAASRQRVAKEEKIKEDLRKGKSTLELYGLDKILEARGLREA